MRVKSEDLMSEFRSDPEFLKFEAWVMSEHEGNCKTKATAKQYRCNFKKLRNILQKPINDTAQDTVINAVRAAIDNCNSQAALINIAILVRSKCYELPVNELVEHRSNEKSTIINSLKQNNMYMVLPSLDEFDKFIEETYQAQQWVRYIINHLLRHYFVRNKDLMFHFVETQRETQDTCKNYMLWERKHLRMTWIRNDYKTANKYGQKRVVLDNERLLMALKKANQMGAFPLADDETKIGYIVKKESFKQLGEGAIMKIIVNHYKADINELMRISGSRGTDLPVLLTSYNIVYHD